MIRKIASATLIAALVLLGAPAWSEHHEGAEDTATEESGGEAPVLPGVGEAGPEVEDEAAEEGEAEEGGEE